MVSRPTRFSQALATNFSAAEQLQTPAGADQQGARLQFGDVPDDRIVQPFAEPAEIPAIVLQQAAVGGEPGAAAAVADGVQDIDAGGEAAQPVAAVPFEDLAIAAAQQIQRLWPWRRWRGSNGF